MTQVRGMLTVLAFMICLLLTERATAQLIPRTPFSKPVTITKPAFESRLTVKFRDDLKVRAINGPTVSQVGADLANLLAVKAQYALTFRQLIRLP